MDKLSMHRIITSNSPEETQRLAELVAQFASGGLVIALDGELGAGKTHFARAFCIALGANPNSVNSPTFVLMQYYSGSRLLIAHMDAYRLADLDEFLAIGGDEVLSNGEMVCLVEWADRIRDALPPDHLEIRLTHISENVRQIELTAGSGTGAALLEQLPEF